MHYVSFLILVAALTGACAKRQPVAVPPPRAQTPGGAAGGEPGSPETPPQDKNGSPEGANPDAGATTATLPIALDRRDLAKYVTSTAALRYKLAYGPRSDEGDIAFVGDKATLRISKLPIGEARDLTLEVLEAGVVKLRGEVKGLKLTANMPPVALTLSAVGSDVADLAVELSIPVVNGGSGGGGGGGGGGGNGPSFARDVQPILARHCGECHHSGAVAPDLTTAVGAGAALERLVARAAAGTMPPSPRDKMPDADLEQVRAWDRGGRNP